MGPAAFSIESNSLFTILFSSIMGFAVMLSVTSFLTITTNLNQEARGASVGLFAASNQTGAVLGAVSGGISLETNSSFSGLGLIITVLAITGILFGTLALFRNTNKFQGGVGYVKEENNTLE
jgi:predicted MFS family arabinose efflux permease